MDLRKTGSLSFFGNKPGFPFAKKDKHPPKTNPWIPPRVKEV